ncbi:lytic transglycosylase domain-containing protein [Methylohalobius crimeensis]|uniref:lytic transglycosylase domain-containing protein n=1 Tax=Methylohalobius crimeensis TaxID=244365 RepID=UPI00047A2C37|nr:lytic transglycosylase domain-containing protein [Methylohalobius crimeensis]
MKWLVAIIESTLAILLAAAPAVGGASDTMKVPPAYRTVGEAMRVPPALLYAVALTESNLELPGGRMRPWPWTLNVAGRGERYGTRSAAVRALMNHLGTGKRRVDVGLMQVNWGWHAKLLKNPWRALDPWFNLAAGAKVLKREYARTSDWMEAVGRYHAGSPDTPARKRRANRYRRRVAAWLERLSDPTDAN